MHRTARLAALALALGASGCWTNVCIEGARCSEEVDGIATYVAGNDDDAGEGDASDSCTRFKLGTTCKEEGFPYFCERDDFWYRNRCQ